MTAKVAELKLPMKLLYMPSKLCLMPREHIHVKSTVSKNLPSSMGSGVQIPEWCVMFLLPPGFLLMYSYNTLQDLHAGRSSWVLYNGVSGYRWDKSTQ